MNKRILYHAQLLTKKEFYKTKVSNKQLKATPIKLTFSDSKKYAGIAKAYYKFLKGKRVVTHLTIDISNIYLKILNKAEIIDTIRHELAHSLDYINGSDGGHGDKWKEYAVLLKARPEEFFNLTELQLIKLEFLKQK